MEEFQPDLILLDIVMPKLNGLEVFKELKRGEKTKNISTMILTNLADGDPAQKAKEAGVTDYLIKSDTSLEQLTDMIKERLPDK